jgi:hypothetical protein
MNFSLYNRWYSLRRRFSDALVVYWHYRPNHWYLWLSLSLQILLWFFAYRLFVVIGSDLFVAHYNVDFGIDSVGSSRRAFNIPLLALAVLIINFFILTFFSRREHFHFLAHAFGLASLLSQLLAASALTSVYLINFLA